MDKYVVFEIYCLEISSFPIATHAVRATEDGYHRVEVDREYLRTMGEMADW